jgi:hypothetical protein
MICQYAAPSGSSGAGGYRVDGLGRDLQRFAFGPRFTQARRELADSVGQLPFAQFDSVQELLDDGVGHHAPRHRAGVPASRSSIRPADAR